MKKVFVLLAIATLAWGSAMAQETTTVDFNDTQDLTVSKDQVSGTTYSFTDEQGVTFSMTVKDWVNLSGLRLYQLDANETHNVTFSWEAPAGYIIQVNGISFDTRVYTFTTSYCNIGATATSSNYLKKVQNAVGTNTSVESTCTFAEGNGSTIFSYLLDGRRGIFTDAGSVYLSNLSVTYKLFHRDLVLDETEARTYTAGMHKNVTVNRALSTGTYAALCLPFDYAPTGWNIYEMTGQEANGGNVTFKFAAASTIKAGVPYIVNTNTDVSQINLENVNLVTEAQTKNLGYADFKGTFAPTTLHQGDIYLSNANAFKELSAASANMKGFRSYITNINAASNTAFNMQFDDTVTAIESVNGDILANDAPIYNLKGQRVNLPTEAGVYVQNGRKFIIK